MEENGTVKDIELPYFMTREEHHGMVSSGIIIILVSY
jgi:hypothetical protein